MIQALQKARDAGADVTLRKPVRLELMVEVVEGLLREVTR